MQNDITLTLQGSASVHEAFRIISKFSEASGIQLNQKKTHGLKINYKSGDRSLPQISWNKNMIQILGTVIGRHNLKPFGKAV